MNYIEQNRDFKGVWIPKEIWLNENLTMLEKVILIEIDSLDNEEHCVAGNDYLAKFCQCSEWKVSTAIKKLKELRYIEIISFDGRHRRIRSCIRNFKGQHLENPKAESGKPKAINITNNITNNIASTSAERLETNSMNQSDKKISADDVFSKKNKTLTNTPRPPEVSNFQELVNSWMKQSREVRHSNEVY